MTTNRSSRDHTRLNRRHLIRSSAHPRKHPGPPRRFSLFSRLPSIRPSENGSPVCRVIGQHSLSLALHISRQGLWAQIPVTFDETAAVGSDDATIGCTSVDGDPGARTMDLSVVLVVYEYDGAFDDKMRVFALMPVSAEGGASVASEHISYAVQVRKG